MAGVIRNGAALLAASALAGMAGAAPGSGAPTVRTAAGSVAGVALDTQGAIFRGIPYAAAPTGALRWRSPQPVPAWSGVRPALKDGAPCAQPNLGWNGDFAGPSSEDCLYLNVFTPKLQSSAKLPVMVWIHGGAFTGGAGGGEGFDGSNFARQGVVLVSINYRLGVFGFLAHPELSATSGTGTSGNYGIEDQAAALKWVQANIRAFGGDPANITMFGQSAGGGSVMNLMISPLTKGVVSKAIIESGAALRMIGTPPLKDAEQIGLRFANGASMATLRGESAAAILQRFAPLAQGPQQAPMTPIVDGRVIPIDVNRAFIEHKEHRIPLIIGNNAREGFGMIPDAALPGAIRQAFGAGADRALAFYGLTGSATPAADPVLGNTAAQFLTDTSFRCGAVVTALRRAGSGARTWEYHFEQSIPGRERDGSAHSYELPYVFGNLAPGGFLGGKYGAADRALADVMIRYWTNFAKRGDPNGAGLPAWPAFDRERRGYIRFATALPGNAEPAEKLRGELCDLYAANVAGAPAPAR